MLSIDEYAREMQTVLRIKHDKLHFQIRDTVQEALEDLRVCGVKVPNEGENVMELEPLIWSALKLYCKAEYTDDTGKAAEYLRRYESLKSCLMMAGEYKEGIINE